MAKKKEQKYITASDIVSKISDSLYISPAFDLAVGKIPLGSWLTISGKPKLGKAQPLDSVIYTPNGPIRMGDIKVGDTISGPYKDTTKVIAIHPQGKKDIYRITFDDGRTTECCDDHLWRVRKKGQSNFRVISLRELRTRKGKYQIQLPEAIEFKKKKLILSPYVMGIILNDPDNITKSYANKRKEWNEFINNIEYEEQEKYVEDEKNKFIPEEYLNSTIKDRVNLLDGLLSSTKIDNNFDFISYKTSSKKISENIQYLVRSLGGKCFVKESRGKYNILFTSNVLQAHKKRKNKLTLDIVKIEHVGKKEAQCITVKNDNGLYITDDFIVTHNTTLALHIIKKFLQKYSESNCLYVDIEHRMKKLQLTQNGLPHERIMVQRSSKGNILQAEEHLDLVSEYMKDNEKSIIVIDSTSALCSEKEYVDPVSGNTRSLGPKILANFCRKNASVVPVQEHIVILISHVIANTSGYGKSLVVDSGNKIQFQSDISLQVKKKEEWIEDNKIIGQKNTWDVEWAAEKAPGAEFISHLRYNHGIDEEYELMLLAIEFGLIDQAGAWCTLSYLDNEEGKKILGDQGLKLNGVAKVYQFLQENREAYLKLEQDMQQLIT